MNYLDLDWSFIALELTDNERCGIVLNSGEIVELTNSSSYPYNSFTISAQDVQPYQEQISATWHTHPRGPNNLSIDDYNTFMDLKDLHHLIITHRSISIYKSDGEYVMNIDRRLHHGQG